MEAWSSRYTFTWLETNQESTESALCLEMQLDQKHAFNVDYASLEIDLAKWKVEVNKNCTLCQEVDKTIEHLMA